MTNSTQLTEVLKQRSGSTKQVHAELDAIGRLCPWPLLMSKQALQTLAAGEVLRVSADDPLAELDLRSLCERAGHSLLELQWNEAATQFIALIRKSAE
jgi:tRNA 2-thiouridine synthesizing protein A